jgi:hypothetical protein
MNAAHKIRCLSSVVEHFIGNEEVDGSIPSGSTIYLPRVVASFWSKVDVKPRRLGKPESCWNWRGAVDRYGYGQFKPLAGTSPLRAHRVAWEIWHLVDIPDGMQILHSCDNPRCCNPNHLRPGTHTENMADKVARGRHKSGALQHSGDAS